MIKARRKIADSAKRVALYLRVSTAEQTTANQRRQLKVVAARHGWTVVRVFEDAGISGAKDRNERPALDAMLKAVARREMDMVAAWSVDRLGRSLMDLLVLLRELHAQRCRSISAPTGTWETRVKVTIPRRYRGGVFGTPAIR
jgi:DNA invertase Pin-like site-specific DNA recombinase